MTLVGDSCAHPSTTGMTLRKHILWISALTASYGQRVFCSIRERIRNLSIPIGPEHFPRFLWEGEKADPQNLNKGFLRGGVLLAVGSHCRSDLSSLTYSLQAMLSMLIGPSIAKSGEGSGSNGYADKFNMTTMTFPTIAFTAALVRSSDSAHLLLIRTADPPAQTRHALTTDSRMGFGGGGAGFNHLNFYNKVLSTVAMWSEPNKKGLIEWWNMCAPGSPSNECPLTFTRSLGRFYRESVEILPIRHPLWARRSPAQPLT